MTRQLLLTFLALATLGAACDPESGAEEEAGTGLDALFDKDELVIVNDNGERLSFQVYLAVDVRRQRRGLMFVRELPEMSGMLFVYERAGMLSMWMKNTYIPLDLVFARADGSVSSVIHNTRPLSLDSQASVEPVNFVLELNAGTARRLKIGERSRLLWNPD